MEEWEVIHVYTREQAIEDGIIFSAGKLFNRQIDLTTNLIEKLSKHELAKAIIEGLSKVAEFKHPDMAEITVGEHRIWVDDNGSFVTLMLPEDY
jgi:hypothetical protein